jgi:hypothetical protein
VDDLNRSVLDLTRDALNDMDWDFAASATMEICRIPHCPERTAQARNTQVLALLL